MVDPIIKRILCENQRVYTHFITLVVAVVDDVIIKSKMSDIPKTFIIILTCLDDCKYKVSNLYKVINLLAVANMSDKIPQDLCGWHSPSFNCRGV